MKGTKSEYSWCGRRMTDSRDSPWLPARSGWSAYRRPAFVVARRFPRRSFESLRPRRPPLPLPPSVRLPPRPSGWLVSVASPRVGERWLSPRPRRAVRSPATCIERQRETRTWIRSQGRNCNGKIKCVSPPPLTSRQPPSPPLLSPVQASAGSTRSVSLPRLCAAPWQRCWSPPLPVESPSVLPVDTRCWGCQAPDPSGPIDEQRWNGTFGMLSAAWHQSDIDCIVFEYIVISSLLHSNV